MFTGGRLFVRAAAAADNQSVLIQRKVVYSKLSDTRYG